MGWITDQAPEPWRKAYRPAKYKGATFHVEDGGKGSGRRIALHEYPKKDGGYAEDMGRRIIVFDLVGYIIEADRQLGWDYRGPRDALIRALESAGPGTLVHPTLRGADNDLQCICERYSFRESRERGGYAIFEMRFVEAGQAASQTTTQNTAANVSNAAAASDSQAATTFANSMGSFNSPAKQTSAVPRVSSAPTPTPRLMRVPVRALVHPSLVR
jgi:prophage DNA circulation protein